MNGEAAGGRILRVGLPVAAVLSVASLALLRVRFSGSPDASFYLGHIVDLAGQAERYGQTYHGNRIGYLLVDRWFVLTFGLEPGLMLARHVILGVALLAAFALGARWAGVGGGVLVAASVAFVPWLPRELMWTFYDGFAVTYLLTGTALLFVPVGRRARAAAEVAAGLLFAMAINANLALAAIVGITGLSWWMLRREEGIPRLASATARLLAGWAAGSAVIALTLRGLYPDGVAFPELVALRVGLDVLATAQYFTPLRALGWRLAHLAPVVAVMLGLGTLLLDRRGAADRELRPLVQAAALQVGGVAALALVLHFVTQDTWFGAPYYTIYHLPGAVLGLAAVLAAVTRRSGAPLRGPIVAVAVVTLAGWYSVLPLPEAWVIPVATVGLVAVLAAPIAIATSRRGSRTLGATMALMLLSPLGATASGWHAGDAGDWGSIATRNAAELDLIRHGEALKEVVEGAVGADERLQFWHTTVGRDGAVLTRLNMVFYGTGEGRVQAKGGDGMPTLSDAELAGLRDGPPVVVLLAASSAEVTAGIVALQLAGFRPVARADILLDGEVVDVSVRIVDLG
jgi:hypothetical protein